jgi:tricorn protease
VSLRKDGRFPFAPADELHGDEAERKASGKPRWVGHAAVDIDLEGIAARPHKVPVPSGRFSSLRTDGARLWEYDRRRRVEGEGKGAIGYVHLRAMGGSDYAQWARDDYPVFQRQGLIVDVRHNNGGNTDSWILGKLIGTRTWGGESWLSWDNFLVDNGIATAAENGVYGPEGRWLIEGHGVDPDVVVDNLPRATFDGKDEQLERAIAYLQEKIRTKPVKDVPPPAFPRT